jgi:UPF0716 protein FxsA
MWLLVAFIAIPMIEIALFIQVGGLIGLWPTLFIVLLTAIIGTAMVRSQGRQALIGLQKAFSQLDDPTEHLMNGAMILVAGVLLLTPGFFTDAVGLALLVPAVRSAVFKGLRARISMARFQMGGQRGSHGQPSDPFRDRSHPAQRPDIIDGEFHEIEPQKRPTHRPSGWTRH